MGGGSILGRLKRFLGGLFGSSPVTKVKAKKKLDKHLGKSYRKGQANYRIQKVRAASRVLQAGRLCLLARLW